MFDFNVQPVYGNFKTASGKKTERYIEVRKDPVYLKNSRITFSRSKEKERGIEKFYIPPDIDMNRKKCPFCSENIEKATPVLSETLNLDDRLVYKNSILFPNLFPYTEWSGVSIFNDTHYVEIGSESINSYRDCLINCSHYLSAVKKTDPASVFMAITQNYLPAAGGSLIHPHLQVHATKIISENHRILQQRADQHKDKFGSDMFSDYVKTEKKNKERYIGNTGSWEWMAAFAPRGFFEIWGICPGKKSIMEFNDNQIWEDLAEGIINTQKFYKSMNRNSCNFTMISIEDNKSDKDKRSAPELMISIMARSGYAPWVRSDITGFEFAFNEMATFTSPETTAENAESFWK